MNAALVSSVVLACTLGGILVGQWLRIALPPHHLDKQSRDVVKVGIGLIATMTSLVLGLVTASVKSSFDAIDSGVKHTAMDLLTLDRLLVRYGPEAREIRGALRDAVAGRIDAIWPKGSTRPPVGERMGPKGKLLTEGIADRIAGLSPGDEPQRLLKSQALDLSEEILKTRWVLTVGGGSSVPVLFLVILLFWLATTFATFGLLAPRNATVLVILLVCAVSVAGAVFLILEMDQPFAGLLQVSDAPLRYAHAEMSP